MLLADVLGKEDTDELFRTAELEEQDLRASCQAVDNFETDYSESRVSISASGLVVDN